MEYEIPKIVIEVLGICGMNGGSLVDHSVQTDRHLIYDLLSDGLLQDNHDLLASANGEGRNDDFAALVDGLLDHVYQSDFCLFPRGLNAVRPPVGGLSYQRFQSRKIAYCRIEEPGSFELLVSGKSYIVKAVSNVEVGNGGAQDVAGIVHGQFGIRCNVGYVPVVEGDSMLKSLTNHCRVVWQPLSLASGNFDVVELQKHSQIPGRRSAVNRPFVTVFVEHGNKTGMVQVSMRQDHGIDLI